MNWNLNFNLICQGVDLAFQGQQALRLLTSEELARKTITLPSDRSPGGSRFEDKEWVWPKGGISSDRLSLRCISFYTLEAAPVATDQAKRYLLALMLFPSRRYNGLAGLRRRWGFLTRLIEQLTGRAEVSLSGLTQEALREAFVAVTANWADRTTRWFAQCLEEIQDYAERAIIPPMLTGLDLSELGLLGAARKKPETIQDESFGKWKPLPDLFLSRAGIIWSFYLKNVMPNLISILNKRQSVRGYSTVVKQYKTEVGRSGIKFRERKLWEKILDEHTWTDASGRSFNSLPFEADLLFPPKNKDDWSMLVSVCQGCLFQILLLMTGGRRSEILSLTQKSLDGDSGPDRTLKGRTYKFSQLREGDPIEWPLPEGVAEYIYRQAELAASLLMDGSESLWVSTNKAYQYQGRIDGQMQLTAFVRRHKLKAELGLGNYHPHRFRKSVARLVVLTLTGSPMILQSIFGHQNIQTTINYILSDPDIREEMREFALERTGALAHEVATHLDEAAGNGAKTLRSARERFFDILKVPKDERNQRVRLDEFVAAHLAGGTVDLKMIFPGIVCIKAPGGTGLCGNTEIIVSGCKPNCANFLVLPSAKEQVNSTIDILLDLVLDSIESNNMLLRKWYGAQLLDYLGMFDDVTAKFESDPRFVTFRKLVGNDPEPSAR